MSSQLSILNSTQREQIEAIYDAPGKSIKGTILGCLMDSAVAHGGLSKVYPTYDPELHARVEITQGSVLVKDSIYWATWDMQDSSPVDTHVTIAVATSWEFKSEERAVLERMAAWKLGDELSPRVKFTYSSC
ncbi:hypothetical protein PG993_007988 [Apiospora rasikravindrae]|uniref:Uncharacterized protein n=1 Tax=Apiospora rasikravindrae TaxID=990691 RepID=A0ABR1SZE5_9PEZI